MFARLDLLVPVLVRVAVGNPVRRPVAETEILHGKVRGANEGQRQGRLADFEGLLAIDEGLVAENELRVRGLTDGIPVAQVLPNGGGVEHGGHVGRRDEGSTPSAVVEEEVLVRARPRSGNKPSVGLLLGAPDQALDLLRMLPVVAVENRDELALSHGVADVARRVRSGVGLVEHHLDAPVHGQPFVEPFGGVPAGAVVNDDDFDVPVALVAGLTGSRDPCIRPACRRA